MPRMKWARARRVSKEFTFKSEDVMTELVEFEVMNLSAFIRT